MSEQTGLVGRVAWFDVRAGYGHIEGVDNVKYIVHRKCLRPGYLIRQDDTVQFSVRDVPAGKLATDVRPAKREAPPIIDGAAPSPSPGSPRTEGTTQREVRRVESAASQTLLAQAMLFQERGNEKKARELFEKGMSTSPSPQLVTAYAAFERNRSRLPDAAREVLNRGLAIYANENRIRADLLTKLGQLELRARQPAIAVNHLLESIKLSSEKANTGEQHRLLALAQVSLPTIDAAGAWRSVEMAATRGVSFTETEAVQLLPCLFGGNSPRLALVQAFFRQLAFSVTAIGDRLDGRLVNRPPELLTLLVRGTAVHSTTYDLGDDLVVICHLGEVAEWSTLTSAEQLFENFRRNANVNPNCFFFVCHDPASLRRQLLRRAEQPGKPIIIPMHDSALRSGANDQQSANREFQEILHDWVFQVDRFRTNQPVSGRNFFGRERVFGSVEAQIEDGHSLAIFGLRKIGKTSILKQLAQRRLIDVVGYVDLQALPPGPGSIDYILWLIGNALAADARAKYGPQILENMQFFGKHVAFPSERLGLSFDGDLNRLAINLEQANLAAKARIVIMLDEVERIIPLASRQGVAGCDELFGYLRGKAQQHPWFISIVAGANAKIVEEPHWFGVDNPVFRFYQPVFLPPLDANESSEMVTVLGRGMGMTFTTEALSTINRLTGRHPFVVRQLCSLLARTLAERPVEVTENHVQAVADAFALEEHATFREMFERLARDFPEELAILKHLAIVKGATLPALDALFGVKAREAMSHLRGYSLVESSPEQEYSISFPLLAEWIQSHHAITEPPP